MWWMGLPPTTCYMWPGYFVDYLVWLSKIVQIKPLLLGFYYSVLISFPFALVNDVFFIIQIYVLGKCRYKWKCLQPPSKQHNLGLVSRKRENAYEVFAVMEKLLDCLLSCYKTFVDSYVWHLSISSIAHKVPCFQVIFWHKRHWMRCWKEPRRSLWRPNGSGNNKWKLFGH